AEPFKAGRVLVYPHRRPIAQPEAADALLGAALLLRERVVADDREAAPALADLPSPEFARRRLRPVAGDLRVRQDAGPIRAEELREVVRRRRQVDGGGRGIRRWGRGELRL